MLHDTLPLQGAAVLATCTREAHAMLYHEVFNPGSFRLLISSLTRSTFLTPIIAISVTCSDHCRCSNMCQIHKAVLPHWQLLLGSTCVLVMDRVRGISGRPDPSQREYWKPVQSLTSSWYSVASESVNLIEQSCSCADLPKVLDKERASCRKASSRYDGGFSWVA